MNINEFNNIELHSTSHDVHIVDTFPKKKIGLKRKIYINLERKKIF